MTLGDLTTQFTGMLNNTVVTKNTALVSTFISQAITRIQRELRLPFMEKQLILTIPATGYTGVAIPSDLLELIELRVDGDGDGILEYPLTKTSLQKAVGASEWPGSPPAYFARQGGSWILGPPPAASAQVLIYYYAEFAPVVNPTDTNTCLKVAWDAVLYAALSAACDYLVDDRAAAFEARYAQITKQLQDMADVDDLAADATVDYALKLDTDDCW